MRRSKRKASAVATGRLAEAVSATAADATCTATNTNQDESDIEFIDDEAAMSDGENQLHGPCNVRPCDQDEDARFFFLCLCFTGNIFTDNATISKMLCAGVALLVDILQRNSLST